MSKESGQTVKNAMAEIRKTLPSEELDKIGSHLKTVEREFSDVFEDVQTFLNESISRKEKLREKEVEIEKLKDEIAQAKDTSSTDALKKQLDDLKKENDTFKTQQAEIDKQKRSAFVSDFEKYKNHADFEKVKPFLEIPDEVNGKIDWENAAIDDIKLNLAEIEKARSYGSFADVKPPGTPGAKVPPKTTPTKDPFEKFPGPK